MTDDIRSAAQAALEAAQRLDADTFKASSEPAFFQLADIQSAYLKANTLLVAALLEQQQKTNEQLEMVLQRIGQHEPEDGADDHS